MGHWGVFAVIFFAVSSLFMMSTFVSVSAQQATGSATILGSCGITFPDGNVVDYGPLLPNSLSVETELNMTNTGSVNATLDVAANNWKDISNNDVMLASVTHFNVTAAQGYGNNTGLEAFDQILTGVFDPDIVLSTFWQILATLINPSFTGSATQTMNFTVTC